MVNQTAFDIIEEEDSGAWQDFRNSESGTINLSRAHISNKDLRGFDFSNCEIDDAIFDDCLLSGTDFSGALLRRVRFRKCDLSSADFDHADVDGVFFDRCEVYDTNFRLSHGLKTENIDTSLGDESTILPNNLAIPINWLDLFSGQEIESDNTLGVPEIPVRVFAPVETEWSNDKLVLAEYENHSFVVRSTQDRLVEGLGAAISDLAVILANTNFDQRIVKEMGAIAAIFPGDGASFGKEIFSIWFRLRPTFEYAYSTKGQHSDYIEAKIISFELNFKQTLNTYEEWRDYQAASNAVTMTKQFDENLFIEQQINFAGDLAKISSHIDQNVPTKLVHVAEIQRNASRYGTFKSVVYGAAASVANVLSRFMQRILAEISSGVADGVRSATKTIVATVIAGSGGTLIWILTTGLNSFPWLKNAWEFVRTALGV